MTGIIKVSETYGNNNYVAFEDSNTQDRYLAERIEAYGLIQFGAMAKNTTRSVDLQAQGLTSAISLKSVYVFSGTTVNDEIQFRIYQKDNTNNLTLVAYQRFTNDEMPYQFPNGAILLPDRVIEVEPRYDVDNIIVYCKPVDILFSLDA